jgi:hypothetical protein
LGTIRHRLLQLFPPKNTLPRSLFNPFQCAANLIATINDYTTVRERERERQKNRTLTFFCFEIKTWNFCLILFPRTTRHWKVSNHSIHLAQLGRDVARHFSHLESSKAWPAKKDSLQKCNHSFGRQILF